MTTYLVTGAQGFVGRYFVAHLLAASVEAHVVGIGRSAPSTDAFTHSIELGARRVAAPLPAELEIGKYRSRYRYVVANLEHPDDLTRALYDTRPDVVVHLAAGLRDDPPVRLLRTNVEGTLALADALAAMPLATRPSRFVLGSSGGVYGHVEALPIAESAACLPIDLYSASKLAAEHVARITLARAGIPLAIARVFNVVGAGQDERHVAGRLASQIVAIRRGLSPPVVRVGPLTPTRDFIDVRDVATALALLASARTRTSGDVYNVASGIERSVRDVLDGLLTAAAFGAGDVRIEAAEGRAADIPRHVGDIARLRGVGFAPQVPLATTLRDLLAYYEAL